MALQVMDTLMEQTRVTQVHIFDVLRVLWSMCDTNWKVVSCRRLEEVGLGKAFLGLQVGEVMTDVQQWNQIAMQEVILWGAAHLLLRS
jgi:hypothetical protein